MTSICTSGGGCAAPFSGGIFGMYRGAGSRLWRSGPRRASFLLVLAHSNRSAPPSVSRAPNLSSSRFVFWESHLMAVPHLSTTPHTYSPPIQVGSGLQPYGTAKPYIPASMSHLCSMLDMEFRECPFHVLR